MKRALIIGVTGQDGAYLAALLLQKNYQVWGIARTVTDDACWRLTKLGIREQVSVVQGDSAHRQNIETLLQDIQPDECYNLAADSFVGASWEEPERCIRQNTCAVAGLLQSIRATSPKTRFFQAGSSEMFGRPMQVPQDESVPFAPCNPYGISKAAAYQLVKVYRETHGLFAVNGIFYNHESPLRGEQYVTRKITRGVAAIAAGTQHELRLGNMEAMRDWGYAEDYVRAMWLMLQQEKPDDYVIATGKAHTIRDLLHAAFAAAGILDWDQYIVVDPKFYRPAEPHQLCGNAEKAQRVLGWAPSITFDELVSRMVHDDMDTLKRSL